ncbi:MAG TPA: type II toxin-antitoxin system Phd/YefM family antitoxin [Planctomycetota bacterium]|jgi:prevent-host-death family protein
MTNISTAQAKSKLAELVRSAALSHEPIRISGRTSNAILISEEDWRAIQETLYLLSVPGMRASIRKGLKTPLASCSEKISW